MFKKKSVENEFDTQNCSNSKIENDSESQGNSNSIKKEEGIANNANIAKSSDSDLKAEDFEFIPSSVYDDLPKLLKDSCKVFHEIREKDIYLTGVLGVLGGCFHNLFAFNDVDKKKVGVNLIIMIVAPPASGKGVLKYAKSIADNIVETFEKKSKLIKDKKHHHLMIPGNISSASLMQLLKENNGIGVIVETEIDTLVIANKQDWGNFSDILRKGFENESASLSRKKDDEYIEIKNLRLSIALSGTPNQFKSLIPSSENGLFSRGCYYVFDYEIQNLKCYGRLNTTIDIEDHFKMYAKKANEYYKSLIKQKEIKVVFSEKQLEIIQKELQVYMDIFRDYQVIHSNIKRLFISVQKIASILSYLYACESGQVMSSIACTDKALQIAIKIAITYLCHSTRAYDFLPKEDSSSPNNGQSKLLNILPTEFTRAEAVKLAESINISPRSTDYYLRYYKDYGLIESPKAGEYKKK